MTPDRPPEGGEGNVARAKRAVLNELESFAIPDDCQRDWGKFAEFVVDAVFHAIGYDRLAAVEAERDQWEKAAHEEVASHNRTAMDLAALQRVVEAAEAENERLTERLRGNGDRIRTLEERMGEARAWWRNAGTMHVPDWLTDETSPFAAITPSESPETGITTVMERLADYACGHYWIEGVKALGAPKDTPDRIRVCGACREREAWIDGGWRSYPFPPDTAGEGE